MIASDCPSRKTTTPRSRGSVPRDVLAAALTLGVATSCVVWKDDYDVMAAKYRNEAAAHGVAREDLAKRSQDVMQLQAKIATLEASLSASNQRLDQNAESMAQAEHQYSILEQQRTEATDLVAQLRAEQERLASHLQAYASDRAELNAERERLTGELESAELRVGALTIAQKRAQARLALVRDLSLKLQTEISREQAALLFDGDVVVLRLEASKMFTEKGVSKEGKRLLGIAGKALSEGTTDKPGKGTEKGAKKVNVSSTPSAEPPLSKELPPRLVLSQWEKGQKLRDGAERLKLAAYELALAGVEPTRFGHEKILIAYQESIKAVLTNPTSDADPAIDETSASNAQRPPVAASSLAIAGPSLVIHLVPQ
jgi:hypothetical protein